MFDFLEPFSEQDVLWQPERRETEQELIDRLKIGISEVVQREFKKSTCRRFRHSLGQCTLTFFEKDVSITAHSGAIRAILRNINHPPLHLPTGG